MQSSLRHHRYRVFVAFVFVVGLLVLGGINLALAQTTSAGVYGRVTDKTNAAVVDAEIELKNVDTGVVQATKTNGTGIYVLPTVPPGRYLMTVVKAGFRTVSVTGITLNLQDNLSRNFELQVGSASESITVTADATNVNTTDASVSTVVDRNFAENLPMNGRSFQSLIELTPGVVATASNYGDNGQFSVNGQRADSNYWMVDGVSANIGTGVNLLGGAGNGLGGALGGFSAMGGTNSLVSVDAMQEFRIQTSTYAPEFGRAPGGQISIVTRPGTNNWHGTAYDYLRNDALDANNWFNGYTNDPPLPKARERQNDFGATLGGPLLRDRTFFFFSYEGLRLHLPQTSLTTVPDITARQNALPDLQPYLDAYPMPNGSDLGNGIAVFDASYSNPASLDAYSLRIDHKVNSRWNLFGRYDYSPSSITQRGAGNDFPLSTLTTIRVNTQTATVAALWSPAPSIVNDLRINYSTVNAGQHASEDSFGGAKPLTSVDFPSPYTLSSGFFSFAIFSLQQAGNTLGVGQFGRTVQRQMNAIDGVSLQEGAHALKFGVDFRTLFPSSNFARYSQQAYFTDVPSAEEGILSGSTVFIERPATFLFRNLGIYAQDTWRIKNRLTLTYGLRWDVDFVPTTISGPDLPAVTGFDLADLSRLALSPTGTPAFQTGYGNIAPRVGLAYQLIPNQEHQLVLRGGFGVFYDLATSETGNLFPSNYYPFGSSANNQAVSFPLPPADLLPPPISPANLAQGLLLALDPKLRLPYSLEWNVSLEQALGSQQSISASYIGAAGRRLLASSYILGPNAQIGAADLATNAGSSDYDSLQLQFQRRLSRGLQLLASYSWAHSIDTASASSATLSSNLDVPETINSTRGPSDFDIRHAFTAGITYAIPFPRTRSFARTLLEGWSTENFVFARSAPPVDISDANFPLLKNFLADIRPDLVPGEPLYLSGSQFPGGKAFNPAAFTDPPTDGNGNPRTQGNVPRNFLRGFGAAQWDFAVHREFSLHEGIKLQLRGELFNVLNHPNFGSPAGYFGLGGFGIATTTLAQYLNGGSTGAGNIGAGGFSPLYQLGGPRSIQLALKLKF